MQLLETTRNHQSELARFCRTGQYNPIRGINEKHVVQYRQLVYNVVDDTLQSAFPLTHHLLTPKEWNKLVNDFFSSHSCQSPQVWTMPKELWAWIMEKRHPLLKKYPFLGELLWFEWLEIELFMMEDKTVVYKMEGNVKEEKLVINPEHHIQHFTYPVYLKNARFITQSDNGHYYLVMHREKETGKVNFTNLSPFLVRMLEMLSEKPFTLKELLEQTSTEFEVTADQQLEEDVIQFMDNSVTNTLILRFTNHKNQ